MSDEITIRVRSVRWRTRLWRWLRRIAPDGSEQLPHPTLRSAVKAVPLIVPPNTRYVVDITGLGTKGPK